jgi:hypothetical protein
MPAALLRAFQRAERDRYPSGANDLVAKPASLVGFLSETLQFHLDKKGRLKLERCLFSVAWATCRHPIFEGV